MAENVVLRDITYDISTSYLDYAMDVIIDRALPDVRDGCKPVHRRILWSMLETGNTHKNAYRKSARTVGDVLGKYHPHGDSSVYDAMVRMAQDFSLRYPFVDGHGNFGSVDGDPPAAMRYTEARMSTLSEVMMEDIDKNTVDMKKNYDETLEEPKVLPSRIPNLLVNGTEGIAVGFASKIPPHNLTEVCEGVIAKIDDPSLDSVGLMKYIKGPDFPLGGTIQGTSGIINMYTTGQGCITVRSNYTVEDVKGGKQQIVFTTVPYQVVKENIIKSIDALVKDKVIDDIADIRDESSQKDGIRIVVELTKKANMAKIIRKLYKHTKLQDNFNANMYALYPKNGHLVPKLFTLSEMVDQFVKHRQEVITRKYEFLLNKAKNRLHIVEGILKAIDIMDDIVTTIRASKTQAEASEALRTKFDFTEPQTKAILAYRLNQLVGLEIEKFKNEKEELLKDIASYTKILSSEKTILEEVKRDCKDIINKFGDDRITLINEKVEKEEDDDEETRLAEIEDKEMVITITNTGYIKNVPLETYSAQSRGGKGVKGVHKTEIDVIKQLINANKRDILLCLGSNGRLYKLPVSELEEVSRTSRGQYLNNLIEAESDVDIVSVVSIKYSKNPEGFMLFFSNNGGVKKIDIKDLITSRRSILALKIKDEDSIVNACYTESPSGLAFVATNDGKLLKFDYGKLSAKGRVASTQRCIKLRDGDYVVNADIVNENSSLLTVTNTGMAKRTLAKNYSTYGLGSQGATNYKTTPSIHVASVINITDEDDILVACDNGKLIRVHANSINDIGRVSKGVRLVKLEGDEQVTVVNCVVRETEEEKDEEVTE